MAWIGNDSNLHLTFLLRSDTIRISISYRSVPGKRGPEFVRSADLQSPPHKWHGFRILTHNPEVVRSNRTPATKSEPESDRLWFFVNPKDCASIWVKVDGLGKWVDPYGTVATISGSGATSYGFTNEYQSQGLIYLRARHYMLSLGRFLTRDTWDGDVNRPLSFNRWMYVEGNPVNLTDPSGMTTNMTKGSPIEVGPNELRVQYISGKTISPLDWLDALDWLDDCKDYTRVVWPEKRTVTVYISPRIGIVSYTYDKNAAIKPVKTYSEIKSTGEESVAIRTLIAESGSRLRTNIHGVQEGVGILLTAKNRVANNLIWNYCSDLTSCLTSGTQYAVKNQPIALDPLCQSTYFNCDSRYSTRIKELQLQTIDLAAIAYMLVKKNMISDFTHGADRFVHRCGGDEYGMTTPNCPKGDPNANTGPTVFYICNSQYCNMTNSGITAWIDNETGTWKNSDVLERK